MVHQHVLLWTASSSIRLMQLNPTQATCRTSGTPLTVDKALYRNGFRVYARVAIIKMLSGFENTVFKTWNHVLKTFLNIEHMQSLNVVFRSKLRRSYNLVVSGASSLQVTCDCLPQVQQLSYKSSTSCDKSHDLVATTSEAYSNLDRYLY